jgi:hypothetical protein
MSKKIYWRLLHEFTARYLAEHPNCSEADAHNAVVTDAYTAYSNGYQPHPDTPDLPVRPKDSAEALARYHRQVSSSDLCRGQRIQTEN